MSIAALELRNIRCFTNTVWEPQEGLNIVLGANGAGKTTLLEGVTLATTGRVLRAGTVRAAVRWGATGLASVLTYGSGIQAGEIRYIREGSQKNWILNGNTLHSPLPVYEAIPQVVLSPETHYAVLQEAQVRRGAMHWALFHVEPLFLETWRRYQRVLRQRNAALRQGDKTYRMFDPGLGQAGEALIIFWQHLMKSIKEDLSRFTAILGLELAVRMEVRQGWKEGSLREALSETAESDERVGYTQSGPHRADVVFYLEDQPLQHVGSHGQQKVVVTAWRLALAHQVYLTGRTPLLLVDDLPAELDQTRRSALYQALQLSGCQSLTTATEVDTMTPTHAHLFHVEHATLVPA